MAKRRHHESKELELTTLLNIMVVLVSSLLLSAVFSQITIQELNMPPEGGGPADPNAKPQVTIEVILRKTALEISNGKAVTDTLQKTGDQYDLPQLSAKLKVLKDANMDKKDAVLLVEPDIDYATMIGVMDAMKFAKVVSSADPEARPLTISLFPSVTVGDAP
jgi:biopolymer transport protein ExbD